MTSATTYFQELEAKAWQAEFKFIYWSKGPCSCDANFWTETEFILYANIIDSLLATEEKR